MVQKITKSPKPQNEGPRVVRNSHPRGPRGTKVSIAEVVKRVEEGRKDEKTIAWARETVVNGGVAGFGADKVEQAKLILERLRKERPYVEDPVDVEAVVSSACLLDGCKGLTFLGEDCDGLVIGFLSAVEAIGIEGAVVAHSYDAHRQHTHVLAAIYDRKNKKWIRCDPSTSQPFGIASKPTRETFFLVPGGKVIGDTHGACDVTSMTAVYENLREHGDFVGVGRPNVGAVGDAVVEPAKPVFADVTEAFYGYMVAETTRITRELERAWTSMSIRHREYELVCDWLNYPLLSSSWTAEEEAKFQGYRKWVPVMIQYGNEVADGKRQVAWDSAKSETVIVGKEGELAINVSPNGAIQVVDTRGGAQVGTVGAGPLLPVVAVLLAALIGYGIITQQTEQMKLELENAKDVRNQEADQAARARGVSEEVIQQNRMERERLSTERAVVDVQKEQAGGFSQVAKTAETVVTALGWLALAGAGIYALSLGAEYLRTRSPRRSPA